LDLGFNQLESIPILNAPLLKELILVRNNIVDTTNLNNDKIPLEYLELQKNQIKNI
jgi:Leucine-rich repeat (LRR) protein